ncbi:MAG: hypothetical protein ACRDQA_22865 [Nocardioidaceae bacterium]
MGGAVRSLAEDWQPNLDAMKGQDLKGLPDHTINVPGHGRFQFHSNKHIQQVAKDYNEAHGFGGHPGDYSSVDKAKGAKVADAFESMEHKPNDPEVKEAYQALKDETMAQYNALTRGGYEYHFYPEGEDPYSNTPREAVYDLTHNKSMFVFPTIGPDGGFGEDAEKYPGHPLLEKVPGVQWDGQDVTYNDMFRAVHDSMAHSKEGVGFGPRGEDNAYRQHAAMYSDKARKALASETRGQNTWVNFGPHAEHNKRDPRNTIFAAQKAGILPKWAVNPEYLRKDSPTMTNLSINTPVTHNVSVDLASEDGKLAFWKQILPKRSVDYTDKQGQAQSLDFTDEYLADLAQNKIVDHIGFLLADKDNAHTMDPDRWRGEVVQTEVRDDGLYGKVVFPTAEAASVVLSNPDLGVSARIRPGETPGLVHVLGTLDPQVAGMSAWESTDLSTTDLANEDEILDLSAEHYQDLAGAAPEAPVAPTAGTGGDKKLEDYTDEDIDNMTEGELDEFLSAFVPLINVYNRDSTDQNGAVSMSKTEVPEAGKTTDNQDLSKTGKTDVDLANERTAASEARANEALARVAAAEWREEKSAFLEKGVPPHALDLAEPVLNRADDMVIDLSQVDGEDDINVSEQVRALLAMLENTVDMSTSQGHEGDSGDGEDPDTPMLTLWAEQS